MPVSDSRLLMRTHLDAAKALYGLVLVTVLLFWLNQDSISLYCQQKYHQRCELPVLGQSPVWRLGGDLTQALGAARDGFVQSLQQSRATSAVAQVETVVLPDPMPVVAVHLDAAHVQPVAVVSNALPAKATPVSAVPPADRIASKTPSPVVTLAAGDEVFLVGDSLMQGVAPHLANTLRKRYQIKSVNLSRQSTGLAYPGFFNWPQTVAKTLDSAPNIRLMVVFLGPNDPWDMPQGKGKPFLRFKSPDWEHAYRQRIDAILEQAREHQVQVIWVGPPNMQQQRLSSAMAYLSGLYQEQTALYRQHYLSANPVLGYKDATFSYTLQDGQGKRVKTRVDDGIHFTITGQKLIADQIVSLIAFPGLTVTGH
ncbi:DUF459 domain-containing protein [Pseudomonas alkylphenolica]|uniref:SGNH/GDSL hydrolase family protein n=1 Tax=Pseudomonas alkylphenolica TaxID=237609 RepID=UPI0018D69FAD|nr:SGNH family hydrolase [Pseudomonas alkylphenolica]MBH3430230.1 DUF459 domain-containing protein [Pseudomonas alkylphenolica]